MKLSEIEIPSNRKFGFFFTFVFVLVGAYFYYVANIAWAYAFVGISSIFLLITLIKSDALLPAQISSPTMWYEHKGTKPHHDYGKNPKDFKEAGMVTIVADPAYEEVGKEA